MADTCFFVVAAKNRFLQGLGEAAKIDENKKSGNKKRRIWDQC
jgi:hypothetical protein